MNGFSKVGNLDFDDDEEEDRRSASAAAQKAFAEAQAAYTASGATAPVLALFERAERCMAPALANGLMTLAAPELEVVLKGRLHQAVILSHLGGRWAEVKKHAEDVLQFDHSNAHARWLRALSLRHGTQRRRDAAEEMLRAIECAQQQGKAAEADLWQKEHDAWVAEISSAKTAGAPADAATDSAPQQAAAKAGALAAKAPAEQDLGQAKGEHPAVQKGFFNKKPSSNKQQAEAPAPGGSQAAVQPVAQANGCEGAPSKSSGASFQQEEMHLLLKEQRQQIETQRTELEALREKVSQEQRMYKEREEEALRLKQAFQAGLDHIGGEIEQALSQRSVGLEARRAERQRGAEALELVKTAATEAEGALEASRSWSSTTHQHLLTVSTEVSTLQQMTSTERRERQDSSRTLIADLKDLAKRLGDLRSATKSLRDNVRQRTSTTLKDDEDVDLQRLTESAVEFHALPWSVKISAFVDDVVVLQFVALGFLFGMCLMLGGAIEAFGAFQCRFVCSR